MTAAAGSTSPHALEAAVGSYLATLRQAKGVSQAALGAELGHDQSYVSKIEHAQRRVSLVEALRWADALGVSLEELCAGLRPVWAGHVETTSIWEREQ